MARPKSDHILNIEDNDLPEEEELTPEERDALARAYSNPIGETARRILGSDEHVGDIVTLKGTRREKLYAHRIDLGGPLGTVYFWEGKAKATPEQKAELLKYKMIVG